MNTRYLIWTLVAVVAVIIIVSNARLQFNSAKNEPAEQTIEKAYIKIISPKLEKKTVNEENIKQTLGKAVSDVEVHGVFYKKTEYSVIFIKYNEPFNLQDSADAMINLFADRNFKYEINRDAEENPSRIDLSGTYDVNASSFGIDALYLKKDNFFWQVLTVYPYSEKNKEDAKKFIDSAIINTDLNENSAEKTNEI